MLQLVIYANVMNALATTDSLPVELSCGPEIGFEAKTKVPLKFNVILCRITHTNKLHALKGKHILNVIQIRGVTKDAKHLSNFFNCKVRLITSRLVFLNQLVH